MKKIVSILIFCIFILSCKEKQETRLTKSISIGNLLEIDVPERMKFKEEKGIDSYVAYLIGEKNDTFHIEYGKKGIIFDLHSVSPPIFPLNQRETVIKASGREPSPDEVIFSKYPDEDREQKIFDRDYFLYDTINQIVVKIVQPKKLGNGITGLYIPELRNGNSFSIYAKNLDSISHRNALMMFRTLSYK